MMSYHALSFKDHFFCTGWQKMPGWQKMKRSWWIARNSGKLCELSTVSGNPSTSFDCAVWRPKFGFVVCSIYVPSELIVRIFAFGERNGTRLLVFRCAPGAAPVISKPLFRIGVKTKKKYVLRIFAPISYVRIGRWLGKRLLLHGIRANVVATVQCDTCAITQCWLFTQFF